jgi:hypothetical protein
VTNPKCVRNPVDVVKPTDNQGDLKNRLINKSGFSTESGIFLRHIGWRFQW